jgi:CYTH domain-containing protein
VEIERKFLVRALPPGLEAHEGVEITQGYLAAGEDGSEVRLRRAGERLSLTAKRGTGMVRGEYEVTLTADQFEVLWPATEERRLIKRRYSLAADDGLIIELDVYSGVLDGLLIAEVEFAGVEAARAFSAPAWFGADVTEDPRYKNRRLAEEGLPR